MHIEMTIPKLEPSEKGIYAGGSLNSLFALCKGLRSSDTKIGLISSIPSKKILAFQENKPVNIFFKIFANNAKPQSIRFSLIYLIKTLYFVKTMIGKQADLIHGHSGYAVYAWVTYFSGLITHRPTVHSVYCPINYQKNKRWLINKLFGANLYRYPLNRMNCIVAMSQNVRNSMVKSGVNESKIIIIPSGIDTEKFRPDRSIELKTKQNIGINSNDKIILFVGNLLPAKGLDILIEAMAFVVKKIKCRLVITTELEHKRFKNRLEELNTRSKVLGIDQFIVHLGIIDFMPQLMAISDIVVAPYRNTIGPSDYPLSLMEAMSTGTCVVGTKVGGIPELIEDGITGRLVKSEDVQDLSNVLCELLKTPVIRRLMGKNARRKVKKLYSINRVAERHINLYKRIISDPI